MNHDVKQSHVGRRRAVSQGGMIENIQGYMLSTYTRPEIVRYCFRGLVGEVFHGTVNKA